jgi:hypothetical protein
MVAGCIHAVVAAPHFAEYALFGAFFAALAAFQLGWGAWVYARPSRPAYVLGAVASAAVILLWVASRTVGVPLGPAAGQAEAVGPLDPAASAIEAAILVLCRGFLRADGRLPVSGDLGIPVRHLRPLVLVLMTGGLLAMLLGGAHHYG